MQSDLHDFLRNLATVIGMTLAPVAIIVFLAMPASLHHHIGTRAGVADAEPQHMT